MPPKRITALLANIFDLAPQKSLSPARSASTTLGLDPEFSRLLESGPLEDVLSSRPYHPAERLDPFEELLLSADQYVALFECNRGEQAGEGSVEQVKELERIFKELLEDAEKAQTTLQTSRQKTIQTLITHLKRTIAYRITYLTLAHQKDITRVRRACRARLDDVLVEVVHEAKKTRLGSRQRAKTSHRDLLKEYEEKIFEMKKESRKKADVISKLRTSIAKAQYTLKKNGILETDSYQIINDERIPASETIDYYQTSISQREEKIKHLIERLTGTSHPYSPSPSPND
ncbi:hypothetical protein HK097_004820 [Rhizophlyctis rosea]|uniref:Uncharacterized protein n=1 Tax=Rhizophlyctis rosea TaxID=64517 RepID=A0AAD5S136_9FUNG|nr:hypothetical protein HK097_004820 [Rhizophlyctis rosea]